MPGIAIEPRRGVTLPLFDWADKPAVQFLRFHERNPHIYAELKKLCLAARRTGIQRLGIRMLWERLRWHALIETTRPQDEWKLNNNYTRYYARLLMDQEPALKDFFEIRS